MIYVMSDIHGQAGAFHKMLKKIQFSDNDHIYILGDVVDRGPDGIEIIKYVMSRKNITLLIGNHEHISSSEYLTFAISSGITRFPVVGPVS